MIFRQAQKLTEEMTYSKPHQDFTVRRMTEGTHTRRQTEKIKGRTVKCRCVQRLRIRPAVQSRTETRRRERISKAAKRHGMAWADITVNPPRSTASPAPRPQCRHGLGAAMTCVPRLGCQWQVHCAQVAAGVHSKALPLPLSCAMNLEWLSNEG